ncbi:MAG: hypothetical protein ACSHX8_13640 [Opitutaceae bacterium]
MKRILLLCYIACLNCHAASPEPASADTWDIVRMHQAATHIFYGELTKILPEPKFKTGVMGVKVQDIDAAQLPMHEIIWPKAKELTFKITEQFKGAASESLVVYRADPDPNVWTYVENETGDVFLARPDTIDPLLEKLDTRDTGLFYVRYYLGSNIPVIFRARFGQLAQDDLKLLRAYQSAGGRVSLDAIRQQDRQQQQALAEREAAEYKVFEDEYYKILRIQDLDIRTSLLNDLVARMGFEGSWNYFDFKERYTKLHGAYLEPGTIPKGPTQGKEKLWHDISGELRKIEVIKKARTHSR